ncbi:WXG100 family type VII secretion target [Nocardia sp. CA-135398]|uniref:WXG100 family type VII secretion target n=1 Tax=Nocardia sp. CA-135398 TaxID=3239977 RepID=UPI003D95CE0D
MTDSYEPSKIPGGGEHVDSWNHWKIYNAFTPLNTTEAHNGASEYAQIAARWASAAELFANRINHSSSAAWDGNAANSSREAINKYAKAALDLTTPLQNLADRVSAAATGVNDTQKAVDKPPDGGSWYNPKSWNLGIYHGPNSAAVRNDCESAAREAMRNHYVNTFVSADKQIPVLPVPNSPTDPLYKAPETKNDGYSPGTPGNGDGNPTSGTGNQGNGGDQKEDSQHATDPTTNDSQDSSTTPTSTDSSSQTPSSTSATQSSSVTPTTSTSTTPSSYPGGTGSSSGGLGGTSGTTSGKPGSSVPGTPTATGTTANAARAATTGTGTSGMAGMGGMGGGRGQSKGDDESHQLPEWLRNMENTEELLGSAPKTVPRGVIGGDPAEPGPTPS